MPSPFPGMDPYLESPAIWPDVHHELISEIRSALNPGVRPRYVARVELRVYLSDADDPGREVLVPDVRVERSPKRKGAAHPKGEPALAVTEPLILPTLMDEDVEEAFIKILDVAHENLVTVIEVVSPSNKVSGSAGRNSFLAKRREMLSAGVHWVEIDLLRAGLPTRPYPQLRDCDYRILVSRVEPRERTRFWPVGLRGPLPVIPIPLRGKDPEAPLDLGAVLRTAYDRAAYDATVDYRKEPQPPLEDDDAKWARELLRRHRGK